MTNWERIAANNKELMFQFQQLDVNDISTIEERHRLATEMRNNSQDIRAYAKALGSRNQMPRIVLFREQRKKLLRSK